MKKSAIFGAWLVATALAVGIGIGAVQLAGAQVTDDPIQPLSADEVPTLSSLPEAAAPDEVPAPVSSVPLDSTTSVPPSTSAPATTVSGAGSTTTLPSGAAGTTSAPSTTVPPTATSVPSSTTATTSPPQSQVTVYQLIGGSVAIESSPGVVNLVWATPNAGFIVKVDSAGPSQVDVDFESGTHKSKFDAEWFGGLLDIEQREEDND